MLVTRLSGAMGAEIRGVDLSEPLAEASADLIRQAFHEHIAIFFPDQEIDPGAMTEIVSRFGPPLEHPYLKTVAGFPFVHELRKTAAETVNFGNVWHTDFTNLKLPSLANALYAKQIPDFGGDTNFINMYAAYEALSSGMKRMLADMQAVHGFTEKYKQDLKDQDDRSGDVTKKTLSRQGDSLGLSEEVLHPVVRTHPETGRQALYVNPGFTLRFRDMTAEESQPLLAFLYEHCQRPEFTFRYRWRQGDLGIWDNRCSMHYAINDYQGQLRIMHRMVVLEQVRPH